MLDAVPLCQGFIWYSAIATRYDMIPAGPTYAMREVLAAAEKVERAEAAAKLRKRRRRPAASISKRRVR